MKEYTPENTIQENDLVLDKETKEPITGIFKEKQFDSDKIRFVIPYKNGKEDGMLKSFYPSEKLLFEMPCKNGIKEGSQKDYYESGELKATYTFKDDIGIDDVKAYYENGKPYAEVKFKGGNLKGGFKYDTEGNQKKVTSFASAMDKFLMG